TSTVQAPQTWTSHERLAPVSPSESRRKSSSSSCGSTSRTTASPLTLQASSTEPSAVAGHLPLPRGPVLLDELVAVLHGQQLERELLRDRLQLAERRRDRLELGRPLERHGRQHRPLHVRADHEHAVVL